METETKKRKKRRFFPGLILGFLLGVAAVLFAPQWFQAYVPSDLLPGEIVQGEVVDKSLEGSRLLLKLRTAEGVMLASFNERVEEIDLLVEQGDRISMRLSRYQPFLTDPPIERVARPGPTRTPSMVEESPLPSDGEPFESNVEAATEPGMEPEPAPESEQTPEPQDEPPGADPGSSSTTTAPPGR